MDYHKLFNLEKEPFSNTPDPDFFYRSTVHAKCLMDVEIAVRLRRGLCLVQGEVGTGKTTLCRQLIRTLSADDEMDVHLVLDPGFESLERFAKTLNEMFCGVERAAVCASVGEHREMIKGYLFDAGEDDGKTVVLIIDEAQKLPGECVEFIRELLNYETNAHKLLQIVLFAQNEISETLGTHPNFADRVALRHYLVPLDRKEAAKLIRFRLQKAVGRSERDTGPVFTAGGITRIYHLTGGYPRKMIHLSHNILLLLLVKGEKKVTPAIVEQAAGSVPSLGTSRRFFRNPRKAAALTTAGLLAIVVMAGFIQFSVPPLPMLAAPPENDPVVLNNAALVSGPDDAADASDRDDVFLSAQALGNKTPEKVDPDKTLAVGTPQGKAAVRAPELPAHLGSVRIRPNEWLWHLLAGIYNTGDETVMKRVQKANPDITNPDIIQPGQSVAFPVINARPLHPSEHYWIALAKTNDLESAYRRLTATTPGEGLRLASFWRSTSDEVVHALVLKPAFAKRENAESAISGMAPERRDGAGVLDLSRGGVYLVNLD